MPNSGFTNNKRLNALRFLLNAKKGFTLIEIMVAIAITALAGAVALPGLRNFADRQQLNNAYNELQTAITLAKSNSQNKTICSGSGSVTTDWQVYFDSSTQFTIRALCPTSTTQITYTQTAVQLSLATPSTACNSTTYLNFNNSTGLATLYCNGSQVLAPNPLILTIKLNSNPSVTKRISVNQGGTPSEQ